MPTVAEARKEKLTKAQKRAYLHSPAHCPYCGTGDIEAGQMEYESSKPSQRVTCHRCKREWVDIYTLTNIEEEPCQQ